MCLILFAWNHHPDVHLVLAANRDEFYARPTAQAAFWEDMPDILAGRDLQAGGTWLGVSKDGRFAAVTNFREPRTESPTAKSRGMLITEFLAGDIEAGTYLRDIEMRKDVFNGFNLLMGDSQSLYYVSNRGGPPQEVAPGIHGLSNHLLNTPWPKVEAGRAALGAALDGVDRVDPEAILSVLDDRQRPSDSLLPDTGVGLDAERMLSPIFIESPGYGTRSSTVLTLHRDGRVRFLELTHDPLPDDTLREFVFRPALLS